MDQELTIGPKIQAERTTDSFGCPFDKLYNNQALQGADISFFRKGTRETSLEQVATPASDRGFAIGISTMGGHTRRIFHEHHATTYQFTEDSIYIRNLGDPYKADLGGPFDFLLLEISPASLNRIAQESDLAGIFSLDVTTALSDPVLANLVKTLIPALERPDRVSRLFVDQLASAIGTHIVQQYGGKPVASKNGRKLSRSHEALAKNILLNNLKGDISILDVAKACNLSRGYFIHAFRETTGMTPYRWLQNERISRACELLRTSKLSLSEVATACGFTDQSHFTRAFASALGTSPGAWRRNA
ncbi:MULTISPECIES: helix-turn-helix domain-containing protein [Agrobacterium]|uniref:helix-turn-helix domain-containing protein n=1 Tax=Agrobacterium TaxID=357 RepID=UPI00278589F1|nr:AraC family transcriptional regulator [Agrobacterium sp. SORGH_AS_0745]MDP9759123.1 AraC family transcriptional regulator [Agrobacterium tumefaciens]MDQ1223553.1 AraC family transcriptional regulator [Agrobacterium sp. SORGH_AS_0745]